MKTGSNFENGQRIGKKIANRIWKSVTSEYLEKLYESMPKRMLAVIVVIVVKTMVSTWNVLFSLAIRGPKK